MKRTFRHALSCGRAWLRSLCGLPLRGHAALLLGGALLAPAAFAAAARAAQGAAARGVLLRTLGPRAAALALQRQPRGKGNDWYQVAADAGRLRVSGSSEVALAHGAYNYLQSIGAASVSWEGSRVALPAAYADFRGQRVVTPFAYRAYLNVCTYGYTTPWWDWARWEREIDWMALHGIDMPLAMEGQDYVWQALWREFGVSDADLAQYFSGPAFAPWQRMGNIEAYDAPLPQQWIEDKYALQQRILQRMRTLGMKPVLPAFSGYVPKAFAQAHPQARIYRMRAWEGFHETYWLDPADPLFTKIAQRFIQLYDRTYGKGTYYLADAFNEMLPPIAADGSDARLASYGDSTANTAKTAPPEVSPAQRDKRLADYGRALSESIHRANPDAVWVMQGWLFGADRHFWTPQAIAAFLREVPNDKLLVLDIGNDRYPGTWKLSDAFDGKQWIYGYVHNYGGSNPVYGDLAFYRDDLRALLADKDKQQLVGFGAFPEGLHDNSVVYEYMYALAWGGQQRSLQDWLGDYTRARYGHTSPALRAAWDDLQAAVLSTRYWTPRWWRSRAGAYLLFKRPTLDIGEFEGAPGDPPRLRRALDQLLALAPEYADAPLYRYDLVDFARHYATGRVDAQLQQAVAAYRRGDVAAGDAAFARVQAAVQQLDGLVGGQQETLSSWLGDAEGDAKTPQDAAYYRRDAKAQISVWGGEGNLGDYASKAWQGMYADYYLPRWALAMQALRAAAVSGGSVDEAALQQRLRVWERDWVACETPYTRRAPADPVAAVRRLLQQVDAR
ncbi:alpha-N-acetylglucosaminidase [Xanthomonas translucens]|uniref:alpha-N-acetylglucosaminidase n=1 Tax=Xanthomonas campestris pv. translucens TaxID=343 RepID=UPI002714844F|nr:alpha-N-acetylglucosaminidase [Xanthomonas translucens]WLA07933.1 alpha-N-acetylglucosaminidase [Xanthomonas translucens]